LTDLGGYHEIVRPKQRYRTINRKEVTRLLDVEEKELGRQYQGWIISLNLFLILNT
jgi:hypothetical protein